FLSKELPKPFDSRNTCFVILSGNELVVLNPALMLHAVDFAPHRGEHIHHIVRNVYAEVGRQDILHVLCEARTWVSRDLAALRQEILSAALLPEMVCPQVGSLIDRLDHPFALDGPQRG